MGERVCERERERESVSERERVWARERAWVSVRGNECKRVRERKCKGESVNVSDFKVERERVNLKEIWMERSICDNLSLFHRFSFIIAGRGYLSFPYCILLKMLILTLFL